MSEKDKISMELSIMNNASADGLVAKIQDFWKEWF